MEITPGWETVILTVDPSGFVEARIGSSPHGQGLRTTLAQIIADELGVRAASDQGHPRRHRPRALRLGHVRQPLAGDLRRRVLLAARKVRAKLIKLASHMLEAVAEDIVLEDGARQGRRHRPHHQHRQAGARGLSRRPTSSAAIEPGISETATYDPGGTFSNACHVAIVEVDIETGKVTVEKFLAAEDAGRIINPMIADGQMQGGIAQGIGNALFEEIIYDDSGNILSTTLADYMPPTAHEIPPIELHHIETYSEATITKAKGIGEGGAIGAPAAVVNAINDALSPFGVRSTRSRRRRSGFARRCARQERPHEQDAASRSTSTAATTRSASSRAARLADAIREDCGQTGTHLGCEHGVCGACTVIVDGEPVRSCLMFAVQAEGKTIRTVEGLANGDELHPMQRAFMDHHGLQCGFCTPGFLMLAVGVLEREPDISDDDLLDVLSSNLCRCTGYQNIIKAVRAAAAEMRGGK